MRLADLRQRIPENAVLLWLVRAVSGMERRSGRQEDRRSTLPPARTEGAVLSDRQRASPFAERAKRALPTVRSRLRNPACRKQIVLDANREVPDQAVAKGNGCGRCRWRLGDSVNIYA
ncbi:hypothetical protein [Cohnella nanjingensis]|uniref:hypothetical protein n=1 Tax=Cohnella nanjingensis TaxID=1387779 RepID=UPI001C86BCC7|nr:hypothetical protein [Cohnella nanjingensis]